MNVLESIVKPAQVLECVELIVEEGNLVEQKRLPGENDVRNIVNTNFKTGVMNLLISLVFYWCIHATYHSLSLVIIM